MVAVETVEIVYMVVDVDMVWDLVRDMVMDLVMDLVVGMGAIVGG